MRDYTRTFMGGGSTGVESGFLGIARRNHWSTITTIRASFLSSRYVVSSHPNVLSVHRWHPPTKECNYQADLFLAVIVIAIFSCILPNWSASWQRLGILLLCRYVIFMCAKFWAMISWRRIAHALSWEYEIIPFCGQCYICWQFL